MPTIIAEINGCYFLGMQLHLDSSFLAGKLSLKFIPNSAMMNHDIYVYMAWYEYVMYGL